MGIEPAWARSRRVFESDFGISINDTEGVEGEQDEERVEASVWHRGRPSAAKRPKGSPGKREGGMERNGKACSQGRGEEPEHSSRASKTLTVRAR